MSKVGDEPGKPVGVRAPVVRVRGKSVLVRKKPELVVNQDTAALRNSAKTVTKGVGGGSHVVAPLAPESASRVGARDLGPSQRKLLWRVGGKADNARGKLACERELISAGAVTFSASERKLKELAHAASFYSQLACDISNHFVNESTATRLLRTIS